MITKEKVISLTIFILFIIATILSYASIFVPFYPFISFDKCIIEEGDKSDLPCAYGESFHIISLFLSVVAIGIIVLYLILVGIKTHGINDQFMKFNLTIMIIMILVFICSFVSLILVNDFNYVDNNKDPQVGFYLLAISTILYFICAIATIVYLYAPKKSLKVGTTFSSSTLLNIPTVGKIKHVKRHKGRKH
jgi:hypothetical protein